MDSLLFIILSFCFLRCCSLMFVLESGEWLFLDSCCSLEVVVVCYMFFIRLVGFVFSSRGEGLARGLLAVVNVVWGVYFLVFLCSGGCEVVFG